MTNLRMIDIILNSHVARESDRFYDDQIAFEAFGIEGVGVGRLCAPPGNGMAVIERLYPIQERELEQAGKGGIK